MDQFDNLSPDEWLKQLAEQLANSKKMQKQEKNDSYIKQYDEASKFIQEQKEKEKKQIKEITSMELPLDWKNPYDSDEEIKDIHVNSISDALVKSIYTRGKVDIEFISKVTGFGCREVVKQLKGVIFQNPEYWDNCFYKGWETSEQYLSGNLMRKLNKVTELNEKYKGYFDSNIEALKAVLPPHL
nr:hypothetical protein [Clostridia bacterium]